MEWSTKRKALIFAVVSIFAILVIGLPGYLLLRGTPSCSDGKQNDDETGVDCGAGCTKICPAEALALIPRGDARVVMISPGRYEIVSIFQNPNVSGEVERAPYMIALYEADTTTPFTTISGETFIPANAGVAIFRGPYNFDKEPIRAVFKWGELDWQRSDRAKPNISVENIVLSDADKSPRLVARLHNKSLDEVKNIEAVAVIADSSGTIIAASRTFVEEVKPGETVPLVYTWPLPFAGIPIETRILTRVLPNRSYIE